MCTPKLSLQNYLIEMISKTYLEYTNIHPIRTSLIIGLCYVQKYNSTNKRTVTPIYSCVQICYYIRMIKVSPEHKQIIQICNDKT